MDIDVPKAADPAATPDAKTTIVPAPIDRRSARGLDGLNFFVANLQTAFGPFIAVYLTGEHWTQGQIGLVLTVGSITAMASQVPAGAFVDMLANKHVAAMASILAIVFSCLLLAIFPQRLPVTAAEILHGFASCMLNPAIAAITLSLVAAHTAEKSPRELSSDVAEKARAAESGMAAHAALGERFGRNASFGSIGNAMAAGLMGGVGYAVSARATFFLGAALAVPGLFALRAIERVPPPRLESVSATGTKAGTSRKATRGLGALLRDKRLFGFAVCVIFFHLSNAGMLPLAAGQVTKEAGHLAELIIAACILVPQLVGAVLAPRFGRWAGIYGRRPIMLVAFAALPLRGLLLAISSSPEMTVAAQLLDAVSSAAFGVMLPLVAADLSRGTGRFNLCMGLLGLAMGIGASFSTTLAGFVADRSVSAAFLMLAGAGVLCVLSVWLLFTETAPPDTSRPIRPARTGPAGSSRAETPG
ncbi:MFS transporter [Lichenicola cladoniae]|uniref:MFS transporter n=1 Tax=Lichenicola cladoniae TaxID=1484109 RepID=A0A6M8HRM4_9PROT|nr:MFS transporter [Lichenicola cladoniae]NPD65868.1 MFS transporter [Acetobacteraceae bacterium]QKE91133.1 MFS transporter [Lichenicola cladoniae]